MGTVLLTNRKQQVILDGAKSNRKQQVILDGAKSNREQQVILDGAKSNRKQQVILDGAKSGTADMVDVASPITLEKRLNYIHNKVDVEIKAERLTKYEDFAVNILKVDERLLEPTDNTPENVNQLIWCEVEVGYNGNLTQLLELWKYDAELLLDLMIQGTKLDMLKIMGEKKVERYVQLDTLMVDTLLFTLPLEMNDGNHTKYTCTGLLNLDYYLNRTQDNYN